MTFSIKQLQASITINPSSSTPTFNGSNSSTITFGGPAQNAIRMKAEIHNAQGLDSSLSLTVYGLPLSIMNQLSTYGTQFNLRPRNAISLMAGDDSGLSLAYSGSILSSIIDFSQPEVSMRITANAALAFASGAVTPLSYNGKVSAATPMQAIATQMGMTFENNGINAQLSDSYFYGSPRDMYNKIAQHADIYSTIDRGTLAIWPKFGSRNSGSVITISPSDGSMIGYPAYTATGMLFTALYNSGFAMGKKITVQGSELPPANATWIVYKLNHILESQTPDGKWESGIDGYSPNFPAPII